MARIGKRHQDTQAATRAESTMTTCGTEVPFTPNFSIHLGYLNGAPTYSPGVGYWVHFKSDPPLSNAGIAQLLRELADDAANDAT